MKQLGFLFNADLCIGCDTCEAACKNEKRLLKALIGASLEMAPRIPSSLFPVIIVIVPSVSGCVRKKLTPNVGMASY